MPNSSEPRKRVLLVDDDSLFLSTIADQLLILSEGSWEIVTADSPVKALALLQESPFHLVAVDLQMPVMNGTQLLAMIRHRHPALHRAVLSDFTSDEERAACLSQGAELCLDKPRSPLELEAVYSSLDDLAQWQAEERFRGVLRGGEFRLHPSSPHPAETIQTPWEELPAQAARKWAESATPPAGTNAPSVDSLPPEPHLGAQPPSQKATAPERAIPRVYPAHPASRGQTSPFLRTTTSSAPSPTEIVFARPVPGIGLDLASAASTPSRLVRDFAGTPVPLPDLPPPETPVSIQEFLLCDGQGQILSQWQCPNPDPWIQLLEFVSQTSPLLAHGLAAGQVERIVLATEDTRIVLRLGVDYGVVSRSIPGLGPSEAALASPPTNPRTWLENLLPPPHIAGWGLWFPDRTGFSFSFSDQLAVRVLDNRWRSVADTYNVLLAHRIQARQLRWDYELTRIHSHRRPDGLIFNLVALHTPGPEADASLRQLLDEFAGRQFAPE